MLSATSRRSESSPVSEPIEPEAQNETQAFGHPRQNAVGMETTTAAVSVEHLNQVLADTITIRDLYKKHHWQVSGLTFYASHLLFDKHSKEQSELVDLLAERVQTLGGVSVAMAPDVAETTLIPRAPRDRENLESQIARLLHAHEIILKEARTMAAQSAVSGDLATNDILVSDVIRTNELQAWFLSEHLQ